MSSLANSSVEANGAAARGNAATGRDEEKEARQKQYKNVGKHEELRRRRNECSVEIRKQKGQDLLMKRRNLVADDEDDGAETSETSDVDTPVKGASMRMSCPEIKRVLMNNPNADQMRHCFESLRRMLSRSENPPIEEVIKEGLLDACIQALQVNDDKLRYEACWSLTNIVSGTSEQTWAAVKAGATQHLVNLSVHPSLNVAEQALWAVANIAGDSSQLRDLVIECRGLEAMLEIARHIDSIPLSFARTLSWAFSNICRHKNPSASLEALQLICQALPSLLNYSDKQVRHDALWAVSYLTDGNDEQISLAVNSGVIDTIFSTLQSSDTQLIAPSLRALGNVCTGNDELTQYVIDLGLLKEIIPLVERVKSTVTMKESTWLLSNILAGTQEQIQAVINAGLLPYLKEVLKSGDYKCQYEAIWALANIATGGTSQQILSMVHEGIVTELSLMLSMKSSEIVCLTLETIYTCLCNVANLTPDVMDTLKDSIEEMGALDKLEELQNSDNDKIYQNAYRIISEFFSDEDGVPADDIGDENQPPAQQYNF